MPLSITSTSSSRRSPWRRALARTRTPPRSVNFTALFSRLNSTCLKRSASSSTQWSSSPSVSRSRPRPFCVARPANSATAPSISRRSSAGCGVESMRPDSMRARSSTLPISISRARAASCATSSASRSSTPSRAFSSTSSCRPTMAFIGVRISWLMVERNWLLAALAWSARCRSRSSWLISCWRSVRSTQPPITPCTTPSPSCWATAQW